MPRAKKTPVITTGLPGTQVNVPEQNQATLPSNPLESSFPRVALGDSGIRMLHGIIFDDYNPQLQGVEGIRIYDEMRKSDGTIKAAIQACTLPIRRVKWFINPATDSEEDKQIAEICEHAIFDWLDGQTFHDVIRHALLMVPLGVMVLEKVYMMKEWEGKTYIVPQKLAPRMPKSFLRWELDDRTFGVIQIRQDGVLAQIAGSKLLVFVNDREGDNWWGSSILRSAYKHWYIKNTFYKIDAIAFERQGLGVPFFKVPQGVTESDTNKALTALKNLRANENAALIIPAGYEAGFLDMGSNTTRDPEKSINHHNKEILQSVLAQFLELGQNSSTGGSRALSSDHSDLFLKSIESIAVTIRDVLNNDLMKELVDMNFNNVKVYPKLDFSPVDKVDIGLFGEAYSKLMSAGALTHTDEDEQYIRGLFGLPPREQKDIDEEGSSTNEEEDNADIEPVEKPKQSPKVETQVEVDQGKREKAKTSEIHERKKKDFSIRTGFTPWRPLKMTEKKVEWQKMQDMMNKMESDLSEASKALLNGAKDDYMKRLHAAIDEGKAANISQISFEFEQEYKQLLKEAMKRAYEFGKNTASVEIQVSRPMNDPESMASLDIITQSIAEKTASDLEAKAKIASANALLQSKNALQTAGAIDSALEDAIDRATVNAASLLVGQGINIGRNDVFADNSDDLHGLLRSEILDERTCDFCLSMDSLVVAPDDPWASVDIFHNSCRGIWIGIMKEEVRPPEITGVPDEIAKYYDGQPNALKQPPKPIVSPGSDAAKYIAKRDGK